MQADHDCEEQRRLFGVCVICVEQRLAKGAPGVAPDDLTVGAEALCELCGGRVTVNDRHTWRRVRGWVRDRSGGGVHAITLREELHEYAHGDCVDAVKAGRSPEQPKLPV